MYKKIFNNRTPLAISVRVSHAPADAPIAEKIQQVVEKIISQSPLLYVAKEGEIAHREFEINYASGWIGFDYFREPFIILDDENQATWKKKLARIIFTFLQRNERDVMYAASQKWLAENTVDPDSVGYASFTISDKVTVPNPLFKALSTALMDYFSAVSRKREYKDTDINMTSIISIDVNDEEELTISASHTLPQGYYFVLLEGQDYIKLPQEEVEVKESDEVEVFTLENSFSKELSAIDPTMMSMQILNNEIIAANVKSFADGLPWYPSCDIVKYNEGKPLPLFEIPKTCISTTQEETYENFIGILSDLGGSKIGKGAVPAPFFVVGKFNMFAYLLICILGIWLFALPL